MSAVFVPADAAALRGFAAAGVLGSTEVHGAAALVPGADDDVLVATALALWAPRHGHAYVDLTTAAEDVVAAVARAGTDDRGDAQALRAAALDSLVWPDPARWAERLAGSPFVRTVGDHEASPPLDDRPLVLAGTHLYTQRQWVDECVVATALRRMAVGVEPLPAAPLADLLDPAGDQYAAAATALERRLAVIVGGPGTGKTYTVGRLLAALHAGWPGSEAPRLGLAAPTGKAAARLTESIQQALGSDDDRPSVPDAVTVHRLLGPLPDSRTRFRHHAGNPMPYDVVVVDETSMVPLPLMARLVDAVADGCRLVLLGDPDQLESIEVGAVLGDIVRAAADPASPLHGCVTRLRRQFRTGQDSPIGPLADAVRDQHPDDVLSLLRAHAADPESPVSFVEIDDAVDPAPAAADAVRAVVAPAFADAHRAAAAGERDAALAALDPVRILCAHRRGPFGVETWNDHAERWLFERPPSVRDYVGRPLLATRNDPRTGIVNGATGIVVAGAGRLPRAVFRRGGETVDFAPAELDELETAYAMTVHKTQGSEYDAVVLIHPPADSPLAGRELLYTAITRSSRRLVVVASAAAIRRAVTNPARRLTGLSEALAAPR
ncbi:exodeoxyribonuclease V subunit alpha [Desertimonas flava]|uniref:exodeoxyribonuclease V subunit alpha n=1 Tax=Desertimonas flava TaxID=2064846 RepID=UPI000E348006|nr:exodeoxyribonuclease V subunit alpha [Desertimonas flava]